MNPPHLPLPLTRVYHVTTGARRLYRAGGHVAQVGPPGRSRHLLQVSRAGGPRLRRRLHIRGDCPHSIQAREIRPPAACRQHDSTRPDNGYWYVLCAPQR